MKAKIGFWGTAALVIGNVVGAGIYFLPVSLAPFGALSIGGWLITALGAILLALMFGGLAQRYPKVGGPYAYARTAFGDVWGFQMAWCYWASAWISNAALAIACVSYMSVFVPALATNRSMACLTGISLIWIATAINAKGVKQTSIVQMLMTVLKLGPLIVVGLVGLFFMNDASFAPLPTNGSNTLSAINGAALLTLYAFIGLESATVPAQHVLHPQKTIPRATIFGTLLCAVLYIAVTISVIGVMGSEALAHSQAPIADAAKLLFGSWAAPVAAFGAVISAFGCLVGWVLLQGQMPYAAAIDGLFPAIFGKLSKEGVPLAGMIISSLLISGLMLMNYVESLSKQFTAMVSLSTFAMLVPYTGSALADVVLRIKAKEKIKNLSILSLLLSTTALAYTLWLIMGAGRESIMLGIGFSILGFIVFFVAKGRKVSTREVAAKVSVPGRE